MELKNEGLTFLWVLAVLVLLVFWWGAKQDLEQAREVTAEQIMATDYCTSLRYQEDTVGEEFKKCLQFAEQHPLETARALFTR